MGLHDPIEDDRDGAALAALFDGRAAKVTVLLELLGLAYSDKRFTLDERSLITSIAHEMGIAANDLGRIDNWVREHIRLIEIALSLMAG
jgi:hypothetical protein